MISHNTYTAYLILFLFKDRENVKTSQLYHILTGKRTASTLYQALDAELLNYFSLIKTLSRKEFDILITKLNLQGWLEAVDKQTYRLTDSGKRELASYGGEHHFPKHLQSLRYNNLSQAAWERMQLVTQVFSEKSYQNRQYTAVIKQYAHQRWCKRWIHEVAPLEKATIKQLAEEWRKAFERLDQEMADMLAMRLTGHHQIGATHHQTAAILQLDEEEMRLYFLDALHALFAVIEEAPASFPLFASLIDQTDKETYEGLSESTWITWKYLQKTYTVEQIAQARKLKLSTVREHLIELAIVKKQFPVKQYVPAPVRKLLHEALDENDIVSFKELAEMIPKLLFYHYRLVQIERKWKDADRPPA